MPQPLTDPGLQAERTELAWRRTQIALVVIACLALRGQSPVLMGLALLTAGLLWISQGGRYRLSLAMLRNESGDSRPLQILGTSVALVVMALIGMAKALSTL